MPTYPLFDFFQEAIMIVWTSREWTWSWIENNIKSVLIDDHQVSCSVITFADLFSKNRHTSVILHTRN